MRVIAGTHRRRVLTGPQDDRVTRPMPDRVKQSLFDRLWSRGLLDSEAVVDIFAGTGSLGIEALSRGVKHCTFIERDRSAKRILEKNLDTLGLMDRAAVLGVDALTTGWIGLLGERSVGLVFCDPPYKMTADHVGMDRVTGMIKSLARVVDDSAVLMLRTEEHTAAPPVTAWDEPESVRYGSTVMHFYERDANVEDQQVGPGLPGHE